MKKQAGFSIVEIAIALSIMALLSIVFVPSIYEQYEEEKVNSSIDQARSVLQVCDMARKKITGTSVDVNGVTTHTYGALPNWSTTPALQALLVKDYNLPAKNAFNLDILVRFDQERCFVAVDLPFLQNAFGGYETTTVNGKTRILISTRPVKFSAPSWVIDQKRMLHDESTR